MDGWMNEEEIIDGGCNCEGECKRQEVEWEERERVGGY